MEPQDPQRGREPEGPTGPTRQDAPPERPWSSAKGDGDFVVEILGGPMDGLRVRRPGPALTIGRKPGNDLALHHDEWVSGEHARIVREEGRCYLEDLGSRHGTFLDATRVSGRIAIDPGRIIVVGSTSIEFMPA